MRGDSSDDDSDGGGDTDNDAGLESLREELDMASEVGQLLLSPLRSKGQVDNDDCPDSDDENWDANPPLESTSLVSAIFCLLRHLPTSPHNTVRLPRPTPEGAVASKLC